MWASLVTFFLFTFFRKTVYSEMKLTQYVNFVFPEIIFSSTWKNTQQSKFSNFLGSYEDEDLGGKTQQSSCQKRLLLVWLKTALSTQVGHSVHSSWKCSKWDSKGIKSFSEIKQAFELSEKYCSVIWAKLMTIISCKLLPHSFTNCV